MCWVQKSIHFCKVQYLKHVLNLGMNTEVCLSMSTLSSISYRTLALFCQKYFMLASCDNYVTRFQAIRCKWNEQSSTVQILWKAFFFPCRSSRINAHTHTHTHTHTPLFISTVSSSFLKCSCDVWRQSGHILSMRMVATRQR